jgi:putative salt-induced outer membrane protein
MASRCLLAFFLAALATPTLAELSGKGELGLVVARGNSDTETVNARLDLIYQRERWSNESNFNVVHARDDGNTTSSRFVIGNKTAYDLDERSYLVGALRYDRDRFSSYTYQSTVSVGYGYRVIQRERHQLKLEVGPGFRFAEVRETEETENELILRGFADYRWTISDTAELSNRFLVESGQDNTFLENALGLSVAINSRVSLKTGVAVRHNTEVEPGRKKTDTLSTVNLVYNFAASK